MKSKNSSSKKQKHSDFEDMDFRSKSPKSVKKERSSKRRLSIYDEFDDDVDFNDFNSNDDLYEK
ncbi:hypothetical protein [Sunxiuqinia elliptica]|uniref:Uncharacterized protein n=1 Tax=Sunxiuqinia elliptica TaxID=655355 RepID=A0A1I2GY99_9BACT|nr:hypothetical protein [Sunxiuqinia elliptica]TDN99922.1 hypothetical protein DET52_106135 [Sunxiuqinia elliptica]TDO57114.1 hypothetical protein DET65_3699 [Sunxiuqinia elliptica]SFF22392.1 hypothetical protein SAMN05216283_103180 [Sunxiuqinia elliptica]